MRLIKFVVYTCLLLANKTKAGTKKSCRKRLKKKYELSESEDENAISPSKTNSVQVIESDEEDQMFISTLSGTAKMGVEDSKRFCCFTI